MKDSSGGGQIFVGEMERKERQEGRTKEMGGIKERERNEGGTGNIVTIQEDLIFDDNLHIEWN